MVGIESDSHRAQVARDNLAALGCTEIRSADFLADRGGLFDFIIGNPPYVAIYGFSEGKKRYYRARYETARGRFDLYLLFFERALRSLKPGGRMVLITPEKFLYVDTAAPLRELLTRVDVEEIELANEQTFARLVTYPTITTVVNRPPSELTTVRLRDGTCRHCILNGSASWMPRIRGVATRGSDYTTLQDACVRVSCGIATGADDVFVRAVDSLDPELMKFARATIAGRELIRPVEIRRHRNVMLFPYDKDGGLLPEQELGSLLGYLLNKQERLMQRTCVSRKPWYAFHETPPLRELLRPKILCKDITERPYFWKDNKGSLVPRHSVYYIVPKDAGNIEKLCSYLNSTTAATWLAQHCQRVANGFLRLQSNVLKLMPIPHDIARACNPRSKHQYYLPLSGRSEALSAR
jgi:hypothetical protein